MIPRTYPSTFAPNGQQQMVVYFLTSVVGLQRWVDYIPVKLSDGGVENSYNNNGYINVAIVPSLGGTVQAWKDYIPVYQDAAATDAWKVSSVGFIPYNYSGFGDASLILDFTNGGALDSRITFTRASTGTYYDSSGVLQSAAVNAPRFDYNPTTRVPLGLLIEEQRTNVDLSSGDLRTTTNGNPVNWFSSVTTVQSVSSTLAPDGVSFATKVVASGGNISHSLVVSNVVAGAVGQTHTVSVYAKAAEFNTFSFGFVSAGGFLFATFTLVEAGSFSATAFGGTDWVSDSGVFKIQRLANDWYRCSVTATATATSTNTSVRIYPSTSAVYNADGSGLLFWGLQRELNAAFATSYIPTATAAATRAADNASITGTNFSSWYNATEGTLYVGVSVVSSSYNSGVTLDIGAGGAFGTTEYLNWSGTQWGLNPGVAPINVASLVTTTATAKVAAAIKANDSVISANGLIGVVDTACAIAASPTTLSIGKGGWSGASNYVNGTISSIAYYQRRLSNAELQTLTT
jgi:hypothetical protein